MSEYILSTTSIVLFILSSSLSKLIMKPFLSLIMLQSLSTSWHCFITVDSHHHCTQWTWICSLDNVQVTLPITQHLRAAATHQWDLPMHWILSPGGVVEGVNYSKFTFRPNCCSGCLGLKCKTIHHTMSLSNGRRQKSMKIYQVLYLQWADVPLETSESQLSID